MITTEWPREVAERIEAAITASALPVQRIALDAGIPFATLRRKIARGGWNLTEVDALATALGVDTRAWTAPEVTR